MCPKKDGSDIRICAAILPENPHTQKKMLLFCDNKRENPCTVIYSYDTPSIPFFAQQVLRRVTKK